MIREQRNNQNRSNADETNNQLQRIPNEFAFKFEFLIFGP